MKPGQGFKRPTLERSRTVHTPVPEHLRRGSMATLAGIPASAIPKDNALQHAGYMVLVRQLPCAHCGRAGPSQFCHSDEGKGTAIKSDCRLGWPGCAECHYAVGTQRIYPKAARRVIEAEMAERTRALIVSLGLWPKNLPLWASQNNQTEGGR